MRISIMRSASWPVAISALAVGLLLVAASRAQAGALNPLDFASLGAFPTTSGPYTINTSGIPTLTESNGTTLTGVVFNGIAVFDFDSINLLGPGTQLTATGSLPLALLSRTDVMIGTMINVSAQGVNTPGPGGGFGQFPGFPSGGPGVGGNGESVAGVGASGAGGGGFGGLGGAGASLGGVSGGGGGHSYGDLAQQLQGGSGGGGPGFGPPQAGPGPGGGGGGAIEIGAVGSLRMLNLGASGGISANGGPGSTASSGFGGGGGSGGGIFLHADSVLLEGTLSAAGGDGGAGGIFGGPGKLPVAAGGGGGGGEVTILAGMGGFTDSGATIDLAGGAGGAGAFGGSDGSPGGAGVLEVSIAPEPASLVLLGTGILGVLGYTWLRRKRAAGMRVHQSLSFNL